MSRGIDILLGEILEAIDLLRDYTLMALSSTSLQRTSRSRMRWCAAWRLSAKR